MMKVVETYKIGSVSLTQLEGADIDSSRYSDGDSENVLYEIFSSNNPDQKVKETMASNPSWPIYYHLSPYRKNVIDWYGFGSGAKVLEIGAGCGAITEALCQKDVEVTALELTKRRAEINAHRNKGRKNLEVVIGNLEDYQPKNKFDYVVCVGVLEYAGIFITSKNPYEDFIKLLSSFLNTDGKLIIAIENRLGLKYFSGSREDHTGRFFDGINQYPHPKKVQTFGRLELKELVAKGGFAGSNCFYPYPDYKNPIIVYSDDYYPGEGTDFPIKLLPTKSHDQQKRNRVHLFSEQLSMISVEKNQLFRDMSNSFVIVAHKKNETKKEVYYYTSTPSRKAEYRLKTYLKQDGKGKKAFYKEAENKKSLKHLKNIHSNSLKLQRIFKDSGIRIVAARKEGESKLRFDYVEGVTLERLLFDSIVAQNYDEASRLIDRFIASVEILPGNKFTNDYLIDLNFDNIIVDKNSEWNFIDYEWLLQKKVAKDTIVQRSLVYFMSRYAHALKYLTKRGDYVSVADDWYLPAAIYDKYSAYFKDLSELSKSEKEFQTMVNEIFSGHPVVDKQLHEKIDRAEPSPDSIEECLYNPNILKEHRQKIQQLTTHEENLRNELELQRAKTRRAELTSPYYLTKKTIRRLRRLLAAQK